MFCTGRDTHLRDELEQLAAKAASLLTDANGRVGTAGPGTPQSSVIQRRIWRGEPTPRTRTPSVTAVPVAGMSESMRRMSMSRRSSMSLSTRNLRQFDLSSSSNSKKGSQAMQKSLIIPQNARGSASKMGNTPVIHLLKLHLAEAFRLAAGTAVPAGAKDSSRASLLSASGSSLLVDAGLSFFSDALQTSSSQGQGTSDGSSSAPHWWKLDPRISQSHWYRGFWAPGMLRSCKPSIGRDIGLATTPGADWGALQAFTTRFSPKDDTVARWKALAQYLAVGQDQRDSDINEQATHSWGLQNSSRIQLLLEVGKIGSTLNEPAEVYFSIWDESRCRFVSEEFVMKVGPGGHAMPVESDAEGKPGVCRLTMFRDVSAASLRTGALYLVIQACRVGSLQDRPGKDKPGKRQQATYRRPLGISVFPLPRLLDGVWEGLPMHVSSLPLIKPQKNEDAKFGDLHRAIIASGASLSPTENPWLEGKDADSGWEWQVFRHGWDEGLRTPATESGEGIDDNSSESSGVKRKDSEVSIDIGRSESLFGRGKKAAPGTVNLPIHATAVPSALLLHPSGLRPLLENEVHPQYSADVGQTASGGKRWLRGLTKFVGGDKRKVSTSTSSGATFVAVPNPLIGPVDFSIRVSPLLCSRWSLYNSDHAVVLGTFLCIVGV